MFHFQSKQKLQNMFNKFFFKIIVFNLFIQLKLKIKKKIK